MAANLSRLNVALTLTTAAFTRSADAAAKGLAATANTMGRSANSLSEKVEGAFGSMGKSMTGLAKGPLAIVSAALSVGALAYKVSVISREIDELAKSADRLGVSIESLQALRYMSDQAGLGVNALEKAMQKLQTKAVEAAAGSESAMDALKGLNLEASALVGMTPDKQIAAVADSLKAMGTAAEKNSALVKLFGEEGSQIGTIQKEVLPEEVHFPYVTKFLQTPKFNLIDGL